MRFRRDQMEAAIAQVARGRGSASGPLRWFMLLLTDGETRLLCEPCFRSRPASFKLHSVADTVPIGFGRVTCDHCQRVYGDNAPPGETL